MPYNVQHGQRMKDEFKTHEKPGAIQLVLGASHGRPRLFQVLLELTPTVLLVLFTAQEHTCYPDDNWAAPLELLASVVSSFATRGTRETG